MKSDPNAAIDTYYLPQTQVKVKLGDQGGKLNRYLGLQKVAGQSKLPSWAVSMFLEGYRSKK